MVFPSLEFAIFFPLVLVLSWALMPRPRSWKPFILAASYVFYGAADPRFCLLLALVTLVNQFGAVHVQRASSERRKRNVTAATVAFDLGVLGIFKYREAMTVNGERRIVLRPDGIHLSDVGAELATDLVLAAIRRDYGRP